jgi:ABC-type multidrug transport system permease subunit
MSLPWWARPSWLPGDVALFPFNPVYLTLAPLGGATGIRPVGLWEQVRFCILGLLASALLSAAAVWRMRAVVIRQAGRGETSRPSARFGPLARIGRLLPSPSLDGNPVLWREFHRRRPSRWSFAIWGGFIALSIGFGTWAVAQAFNGGNPGSRESSAVIGGFQVSAGLLLLSVSASTSLAEERQRGSLDVLLATPLSTPSIVLGKWLGAFRGVPLLAVLPMLISASLATHTRFVIGPFLIGGLVVAYGAAITSLGLALATWTTRIGRAIGLTSGLYVIVTIASVPVGLAFFGNGPGRIGPGVASASPSWGVGFNSALFGGASGAGQKMETQAAWIAAWIVVYGVVAVGLLLATMKTFNRCLGRIDEGPSSQKLLAQWSLVTTSSPS